MACPIRQAYDTFSKEDHAYIVRAPLAFEPFFVHLSTALGTL